jgi:endonuclease YncB( thermonuclease family)
LNNVNPFFSPILVRINGIDAPEIRSRDACEKARAIEAREFLKGILDKAARIDLVNVKKDKYFRLLADVQADGVDVGTEILQKKLARPYHGEAKTAFDWCSSR